jgi:hypothetical protein
MTLSILLASLSLYYAFRPTRPSRLHKKQDIHIATILGSLYFASGFTAALYPGAKAIDPEFGEGFPQAGLFGVGLGCALVGGWLEGRRVR